MARPSRLAGLFCIKVHWEQPYHAYDQTLAIQIRFPVDLCPARSLADPNASHTLDLQQVMFAEVGVISLEMLAVTLFTPSYTLFKLC